MATTSDRSATLRRSLPALLLALLLAFFAAPVSPFAAPVPSGQLTGAFQPAGGVSASAAQHAVSTPVEASAAPARTSLAPLSTTPVSDTARVLRAQLTAGAAGSRAPPSAA